VLLEDASEEVIFFGGGGVRRKPGVPLFPHAFADFLQKMFTIKPGCQKIDKPRPNPVSNMKYMLDHYRFMVHLVRYPAAIC
jgi:hypothetical protein